MDFFSQETAEEERERKEAGGGGGRCLLSRYRAMTANEDQEVRETKAWNRLEGSRNGRVQEWKGVKAPWAT